MPRSANVVSSASDASGDGGIGRGKSITSAISLLSRSPCATSSSCSSSAASLGAGGHLYGVERTPMITRPPAKPASTSRAAKAPSSV